MSSSETHTARLRLVDNALKRQKNSFAQEMGRRLEYVRASSASTSSLIIFLRGLLAMISAVVAAQVHWFPPRDGVNFSVVRRLAHAEVTTCEARDDTHQSLLKGVHTMAMKLTRPSISITVGAEEGATSRRSVSAVALPIKSVTLTPKRTMFTLLTYKTA